MALLEQLAIDRRIDTSYLMCADVRNVWPAMTDATKTGERPRLSFLIPSSSVLNADGTVLETHSAAESEDSATVVSDDVDGQQALPNATSSTQSVNPITSLVQIDCEVIQTKVIPVRPNATAPLRNRAAGEP